MYDTYQKEFVPVPSDRQETGEEKKWTHFHEQEVVFCEGHVVSCTRDCTEETDAGSNRVGRRRPLTRAGGFGEISGVEEMGKGREAVLSVLPNAVVHWIPYDESDPFCICQIYDRDKPEKPQIGEGGTEDEAWEDALRRLEIKPRKWTSMKWRQDPTKPCEAAEFLIATRNDNQIFYVRRTVEPRDLTDEEMAEFLESYLDPKCICRFPQPDEDCEVVTRFGPHSAQQQRSRLRDVAENG